MNGSIKALAAATMLTTAAAGAAAQTHVAPVVVGGGKSVVVSYADLDLSAAEGMKTLNGRIRGATRIVCGSAPEREIGREVIRRECYNFAMAGVRTQLAAAQANQYAKGRSIIVVADAHR